MSKVVESVWYGTIPDNWEEITIGELVKRKILFPPKDGNHGGIHPKSSDFVEEGVPFIMASDLINGKVDLIKCKKITKKQADGLQKGFSKNGDVLLSHKATIGRTAVVEIEMDYIMLTPQVTYYRVHNSSALSSDFLLQFFNSSQFQKVIHLFAGGGSTRDYIGITAQLDLPILLPPFHDQVNITRSGKYIAQKITLLRQQNQDLEELAQTLFKRWFVEFEFPNENGEPYLSAGGKMVESELGEIPEGWKLSNLAELAENKAKTYKFTKKEVVFINTGDVLEGKFLHKNYLNPEDLPGQAKKALELNDILYSEIRPKNKRFAFVDFDASDYVVSTKFMIIKTKGEIHAHILYLILKEENSIVKINHIAEARSGTFPQITFDSISDFEILKAPLKVQDKFMDLLLPTMGKQKNNEQEIQTLTQLRDTLLPKLMSGELRVNE
jgi:type I restriction enzyme S subunit